MKSQPFPLVFCILLNCVGKRANFHMERVGWLRLSKSHTILGRDTHYRYVFEMSAEVDTGCRSEVPDTCSLSSKVCAFVELGPTHSPFPALTNSSCSIASCTEWTDSLPPWACPFQVPTLPPGFPSSLSMCVCGGGAVLLFGTHILKSFDGIHVTLSLLLKALAFQRWDAVLRQELWTPPPIQEKGFNQEEKLTWRGCVWVSSEADFHLFSSTKNFLCMFLFTLSKKVFGD